METHFLKLDSDKRRVYGIALEANKVDLQGDVVSSSELEEAAIRAVKNRINAAREHKQRNIGPMIASFPLTEEIQKALGIDLGRSVWLVGFEISDPVIWQAVKSGEFTGFSVGGKATRVQA